MDAHWIAIILLVIAVVFLIFRGESTRKSAGKLHDYDVAVQEWRVDMNNDFWALRKFVCNKYPGECANGDKKTDPPDPPEYP